MNRSLFISSCSQRQLARRRRGVSGAWLRRGWHWPHVAVVSLLVVVALGSFIAGRGGI
jgi:hypothetical protein